MVGDEQFALRVRAEAGDLQSSLGDLLVPNEFFAIVLGGPDAAGRVVAVNVGPDQVGILLAVINDPASHRTGLGMRVFNGRLDMRRRSQLALEIERMAPFVDRPAVIVALADEVDLLPEVLA